MYNFCEMKKYFIKTGVYYLLIVTGLSFGNATAQSLSSPHTDNISDTEKARIRAKAVQHYPKLDSLRKSFTEENDPVSEATHVLFSWPMSVNGNYDDIPNYYSIVNYWDFGTGAAQTDWQCGTRTYDGHNGADIALWPFWWRMKDNQNVFAVAAAPGIVIDVVQNNIDTRCLLLNYTSNRVAILHSDSSISYYVHIKQNGALVNENDVVSREQPVAYIASSGRSTYPHLHFQVADKDGNNIEPFKNSSPDCNTSTTDSWWQNQKPYWEPQINRIATHYTTPALWGSDPDAPNIFCQLNETPALKNSFIPSDSIYYAIYFHDLQENDTWDFTVTRPDGTNWFSISNNNSGAAAPYTYRYYARRLPLDAMPGTWTCLVTYRNISYRHYFVVNCPASYSLTNESGSYGRIASGFIVSSSVATAGNNVLLQAADNITLSPGFHAQEGTVFKARIRDCNFSD